MCAQEESFHLLNQTISTWAPTTTDAWGNIVYLSKFGFNVDITDCLLIVGDPEARKAAILTRNEMFFHYVYQSGSWRTLTEAEDGMDVSSSIS
ncbi:MAG: hypothetical protein NVV82_26850 [Sporocytophaga sp.]|nr:hypothetical protein [Sporocytophaga sp.]